MSKIVRTFIYDSLLKIVNEEGFLNGVKNRLGMKSPQAPLAQHKQTNPNPDISRAHPEVAAETPLESVISEIIDVPIGESRVVLHLNHEELSKIYLQPDPAVRAVLAAHLVLESARFKLLSLVEADTAKNTPRGSRRPGRTQATSDAEKQTPRPKLTISALPPGFKFSDIYKDAGGAHYSALLNIPDAIKKEYLAVQDKKQVVEKMLDPRYYIMTINNGEAKKIGAAVDAATDLNDKIAVIDPNIIVNYPKKQTIKQAKDLWNSKYRDRAPDNSADGVAQRLRKQEPAAAAATSDETPATGIQDTTPSADKETSTKAPDDSPQKLADLKRIYGEFLKLSKTGKVNRQPLHKILDQMGQYLK